MLCFLALLQGLKGHFVLELCNELERVKGDHPESKRKKDASGGVRERERENKVYLSSWSPVRTIVLG